MAGETVEKCADQRGKVLLFIDSAWCTLADAAQSVGSRVLDVDDLVIHHRNEHWQRLLDERLQNVFLGTLDNSTESRDGSVSVMPVLRAEVLFNELKDRRYYTTANTARPELQTLV